MTDGIPIRVWMWPGYTGDSQFDPPRQGGLRGHGRRLSVEHVALGHEELLEVERGWRNLSPHDVDPATSGCPHPPLAVRAAAVSRPRPGTPVSGQLRRSCRVAPRSCRSTPPKPMSGTPLQL